MTGFRISYTVFHSYFELTTLVDSITRPILGIKDISCSYEDKLSSFNILNGYEFFKCMNHLFYCVYIQSKAYAGMVTSLEYRYKFLNNRVFFLPWWRCNCLTCMLRDGYQLTSHFCDC